MSDNNVTTLKWFLVFALKTGITGLLLYWVFRNANIDEILVSMQASDKRLLLGALLLNFVGYLIITSRWRLLLKAMGLKAPFFYLIKSLMVGVFINNFMPSTIGGDAVRVYDSWRIGKSKARALTVIFVDRMLGVLALCLIVFISLLCFRQPSLNLPHLYVWLMIVASGTVCVSWLIFSPSIRIVDFIKRIHLPFSGKLQEKVENVINAMLSFKGQRKTLVKSIALSLALQVNVVLHYYIIARSLDLSVPFYSFFVIIPIAIFIMMVPVTINAIGVRESVFIYFLSGFGVLESQAVAFAWLAYGLVLLQGLLGGVVYAFRK